MPENKNMPGKEPIQDKPGIKESLAQRLSQQQAAGPAAPETPAAGDSQFDPKTLLNRQIYLTGPRLQDMALFCRQLATLVDVGIPLLKALKILAERTQHPKLRRATSDVARRVEEGQQLSAAMAANPDIFTPAIVNVVRIGETGGILDTSLVRLADVLERKAQIRKKVFAAVAYPVVVLIVALAVLTLIMTFAVPRFVSVYESQRAELPGITQTIIGISDFMTGYPYIYVPLIVVVIVAVWLWVRTPAGRYMWDKIKLTLPPLSTVNVKIAVARTTRTIGNLITAGIPLVRALEAAAETSENVVVGQVLADAKAQVEAGTKIEVPLRRAGVFPPMVVDMIAIGDEAGTLDVMLIKLADTFEDDVDTTLKGLTAIIEPLLIVLLGFVVIIIALGMLLPYFNLVSVIQ
ncbi:MAG: type II secretion system F family protein [Candidatus Sumerlaeia bacterium]